MKQFAFIRKIFEAQLLHGEKNDIESDTYTALGREIIKRHFFFSNYRITDLMIPLVLMFYYLKEPEK